MDTLFPMRLSRRNAVAAGAVALAGAGVAVSSGSARAIRQRAISSGGGIAGGGLVEGPDASAHFVLSGSRFSLEDDSVELFGFLQLTDPDQNLSMTSTEISFYGQVEGEPDDTRELHGLIAVSQDGENLGEFLFVLKAVVAGSPGPDGDSLELTVGAAAPATPTATEPSTDDFSYALSGDLTAGDITLLLFEFPEEQ
jgi:hypothetical protein